MSVLFFQWSHGALSLGWGTVWVTLATVFIVLAAKDNK